jgi:fatty-acyl-CoA synthase
MLIQTARRFPDRPAIVWRDKTWNWASFLIGSSVPPPP